MTEPYDVLREDPELASLVDEHGELALEPAEDPFRRLVVSIVRQQVSMDAAAAIRERLFDSVAVTPTGVASADSGALRSAGLSGRKAEYVQNVAEAFLEHGWDRAYFAGLDDDAVREELTAVTGVGDWTAEMFLMFALGREDVFPVGDLGIRKGMRALYGEELSRSGMRDVASRWRPYRSYGSLYVWRAYEE
ncbi:DNA-3-methyladenine glycosylase family protein [Halobacterium yunchengense]|uniref:DNA-3-methyladenine glycosylase family protein n=1 Tax=Halobacterium yunchengense TaxID=3108497 RepID=UPI0030088225